MAVRIMEVCGRLGAHVRPHVRTLRRRSVRKGTSAGSTAMKIPLFIGLSRRHHCIGIVHRDIKPANILVEQHDDGALEPFIVDFGITREASTGAGMV